MFIDTAKGISHLHTVNIIHRDVAARNLLIEDMTAKEEEENKANNNNNYSRDEFGSMDDLVNINHSVDLDEDNHNDDRRKGKRRGKKRKSNKKHKTKSIPENFSIPNIPKRRVVVCDFGLSRITQNPDQDNVTNSHVGPLKWMSPESIKQQIYNSKTDVYSFGVVMWEVLCGMPPYPNTKVLSLAVEVISKQTRPYILDWFPRPLNILMQRCWQEIPDFRPTFEDIKNELELFKKQLIDNGKINDPLVSIPADTLTSQHQTKEPLRSLQKLVSDYLDEDNDWDKWIKPKLRGQIEKWEESHNQSAILAQHNMQYNMGPPTTAHQQQQQGNNIKTSTYKPMALNNDPSQSTYYDPNRPTTGVLNLDASQQQNSNTYITNPNQQQQLNMLSRMNVSNKRISLDHGSPPLGSMEPKKSKVKFAVDSVNKVGSIPYEESQTQSRQILPLIATDSLSMHGNTGMHGMHHHNADVSVSINNGDLTHNNTSSVQYHHRNLSSKATSMNYLLNDSNSNNMIKQNNSSHRQQNSNLNDIDEDNVIIMNDTNSNNQLTILNVNNDGGVQELGDSLQMEDFSTPPPEQQSQSPNNNTSKKLALTDEVSEVP